MVVNISFWFSLVSQLCLQKFPTLQGKVEGLQQAISTHKRMEGCETDAVLFAKNNLTTPAQTRRSTRLLCTPDRFSTAKTTQSGKKSSLRNNLQTKTLSYPYKKK